MPTFQYGPLIFSSGGVNPQNIAGPTKVMYVIEHQVPGAEGGVTEYVGSQQSTYSLKGFFAPQDVYNGTAGSIVSGNGLQVSGMVMSGNADDMRTTLQGIRSSGVPHLLYIESTIGAISGVIVLYENDFFWIDQLTLGYEAGKAYPYYPYGLDLRRATTHTYGNSSGTSTFAPNGFYFSGYVMAWLQSSGLAKGEIVTAIGIKVGTVASGNMQVGVYASGASSLLASSASQPVHSGWNYFPVNPSFTTTSGSAYVLGMIGDVANSSGFTILMFDFSGTSTFSYRSGWAYATGMPLALSPTSSNVSGTNLDQVIVTA